LRPHRQEDGTGTEWRQNTARDETPTRTAGSRQDNDTEYAQGARIAHRVAGKKRYVRHVRRPACRRRQNANRPACERHPATWGVVARAAAGVAAGMAGRDVVGRWRRQGNSRQWWNAQHAYCGSATAPGCPATRVQNQRPQRCRWEDDEGVKAKQVIIGRLGGGENRWGVATSVVGWQLWAHR